MPLAYYSHSATTEFWNDHWGRYDVDTLVELARTSPLTALIAAALPRTGRVLEAGCGLGQHVIVLGELGHTVVGVDWSLDAVRECRKASPDAPVSVMELGALGVRDGTVAAYVSLGVVEHDANGPERILREAYRILRPGGRVILSVPYVNGVRRLLRRYIAGRQATLRRAGGEFYQYAFTGAEVRAFLDASGFDTLSQWPYDVGRLLRKVLRRRTNGRPARGTESRRTNSLPHAVLRRLLRTPPLLHLLGHMVLVVAVKR